MKCISRVISFTQIDQALDWRGILLWVVEDLKKTMGLFGVSEERQFTKIWKGAGGIIIEIYGEPK